MPPFSLTDQQQSEIATLQNVPVQMTDDCVLPTDAFGKTLEKVATSARKPPAVIPTFPRAHPEIDGRMNKTLDEVLKEQPGDTIHLAIAQDMEVRIPRSQLLALQKKTAEMAEKLGLTEPPVILLDNYTASKNSYKLLETQFGVVQGGNSHYSISIGPKELMEWGNDKWVASIGVSLADFVTPYPKQIPDKRLDGRKQRDYHQLQYQNELTKREYELDRIVVEKLGLGTQLEALIVDRDADRFANWIGSRLNKPRADITAADIESVLRLDDLYKPSNEFQRATMIRVLTDIDKAKKGCTVKVEDADKLLPEGIRKTFSTDQELREKAGFKGGR